MTEEEMAIATRKVMKLANELGLHGAVILSPRCEGCGQLHDWNTVTDIGPDPGDDESEPGEELCRMLEERIYELRNPDDTGTEFIKQPKREHEH